jgi:hypothetical protein
MGEPAGRLRPVAASSGGDTRFFFAAQHCLNLFGKIVVTGNGGYSNALNVRDMAHALSQRYAVVATAPVIATGGSQHAR